MVNFEGSFDIIYVIWFHNSFEILWLGGFFKGVLLLGVFLVDVNVFCDFSTDFNVFVDIYVLVSSSSTVNNVGFRVSINYPIVCSSMFYYSS